MIDGGGVYNGCIVGTNTTLSAGLYQIFGERLQIKGKWNVDYAYAERVEPFFKEYNLDIKLEYGKFPDRTYDSPCEYGDNTKIQIIINNKKSFNYAKRKNRIDYWRNRFLR